MTLRPQKGNMYDFVTHTWNPIKGRCSHNCDYCFMKRWKQKPLRLDEKDLKIDLGEDNFIFVGSSTDMFAEDVPDLWIAMVISHILKYPNNRYLFQSKNVVRMRSFWQHKYFNCDFVWGTTLESDRWFKGIMGGQRPEDRAYQLGFLPRRMVTIEPILNFNLNKFVDLIRGVEPEWVNIGADSQGHNLPEPSWDKVRDLIDELEKFTVVKQKNNLERLKKKKGGDKECLN